MGVRTRQDLQAFYGSRKHKNTGVVDNRSYYALEEETEDYVSPGDNYNFTVERTTKEGGLIYGTQQSNLTGYIWNNYPADHFRLNPVNHLSVPGQPSGGALAADCIARTNPSRSETEALETLSDISQIGSLAKTTFFNRLNLLLKHTPLRNYAKLSDFAKYNLMVQFGIKPLLSDIETLMHFQSAVDRRFKEIDRLRTRGLRRTVDLWSDSAISQGSDTTIQSNGVTLHAYLPRTTTVKVKGHIRWYTSAAYLQSDQKVRAQVRRVIHGYSVDPASIYELMPWSWLIDYFSNLGTIVKASRNSFEAHHSSVRLMTETHTIVNSNRHTSNGSGQYIIRCTPYHAERWTKWRRTNTSSLLSTRIGLLNGSQWSVLGSLAVLKLS
jgi:hypothetical protein